MSLKKIPSVRDRPSALVEGEPDPARLGMDLIVKLCLVLGNAQKLRMVVELERLFGVGSAFLNEFWVADKSFAVAWDHFFEFGDPGWRFHLIWKTIL